MRRAPCSSPAVRNQPAPLRSGRSRRRRARGPSLPVSPGSCRGEPAPLLSGRDFRARDRRRADEHDGPAATAIGVNGQVPAPILRWREGDTVTLAVTNRLTEPTSIHWHGIRTPSPMDGVPGLSFRRHRARARPSPTAFRSVRAAPTGITAIRRFRSRAAFTARSSSSRAPATPRPSTAIMSCCCPTGATRAPRRSSAISNSRATITISGSAPSAPFLPTCARTALRATVADRLEWGKMRMSPTDILDVTGATYTYLVNGQPPGGQLDGPVSPRRARASALHQRLVDEHLRCAHSGPEADRRADGRQRCRSRSPSTNSASAPPKPTT